jgi:regulator of sirC expression with transglutaminase-like and TPR domain
LRGAAALLIVMMGLGVATPALAQQARDRVAADRAVCDGQDHQRAVEACTRLLARRPTPPASERASLLFNRALSYHELDEYAKALADFTAAIEIRPTYAEAYMSRGVTQRKLDRDDAAIADYTTAIRLRPNYAFAYNNRGVIYEARRDWQRALDDYTRAIESDVEYTRAYMNRGDVHRAMGNLELARDDYQAAILRGPKGSTDQAAIDLARRGLAAVNRDLAARPAVDPAAAPRPAAASAAAAALKPVRIALIIGNDAYAHVPKLANAGRDANLVAETFQRLGFDTVVAKSNLTRGQFLAELRNFSDRAKSADWAVIYYAGHGIEIDGRNFLVPVDAELMRDRDVEDEAVPLDRVLREVQDAKKLRLVILDACRDNPFAGKMARSTATRSVGSRGLAAVENQPLGTVLLYAAAPGTRALDAPRNAPESGNSPFAAALARHLIMPNRDISRVFRSIASEVRSATANEQQPFYTEGSLPDEDLMFRLPG